MAPGERNELDLWPYEEARRLSERVGSYPPEREVVFESGFGPSGLPHLGTMGEILRPAYVQHAFKVLGEADSKNAALAVQAASSFSSTIWTACAKSPKAFPT